MRQPSTVVPIIAGFGLMFLLLLAVTAIGYSHIRQVGQQLTAIVVERNEKSELATKLRALHDARHQSLLLISHLADPFDRDEEIVHFNAMAREYIRLRDRFLALPLDDEELAAWNRVREEIRQVTGYSEQALDLVSKDQLVEAQKLIKVQLAPRQAHMMSEWQHLEEMQHEVNRRAISDAQHLRSHTLRLMLSLSAAVLVVGGFVALFVVRLSRRLENALLEEKEQAQVTLSSITDAVFRFDLQSHLTYLNPAAEQLLGIKASACLNLPCHEIVRLYQQGSGSALNAIPLDQVMLGKTIQLPIGSWIKAQSTQAHEIDGQCSPIKNQQGEIIGGVLVLRHKQPPGGQRP